MGTECLAIKSVMPHTMRTYSMTKRLVKVSSQRPDTAQCPYGSAETTPISTSAVMRKAAPMRGAVTSACCQNPTKRPSRPSLRVDESRCHARSVAPHPTVLRGRSKIYCAPQ